MALSMGGLVFGVAVVDMLYFLHLYVRFGLGIVPIMNNHHSLYNQMRPQA